ncbi:MAG: ParB N-terminal domain-containing protein, partial [Clostridia bacterium]|nr:ParB N-terminal domain-containing protein [Clostridia bacterium]
MSIGKSSIARAVNATNTAAKTQNNNNQNLVINKFAVDSIGLLSVAKAPQDVSELKSSVQKRGLLCPVLVAATNKGDVWLVDGYARVAVAKELNINQIDAIVINVDTKTQANNLYNEINKTKPVIKTDDIREEKFR